MVWKQPPLSDLPQLADVWNNEKGSWELRLRRNLKDEEILEWIDLINHIPNVVLTQAANLWIWNLDKNGVFSTKSLYSHLLVAYPTSSSISLDDQRP